MKWVSSVYLWSIPSLRGRRVGSIWLVRFDSGVSGSGSSLGRGHCVVFLGKVIYSHCASLQPGVQMGTSNINAGGRNPAMYQYSIRGGVG